MDDVIRPEVLRVKLDDKVIEEGREFLSRRASARATSEYLRGGRRAAACTGVLQKAAFDAKLPRRLRRVGALERKLGWLRAAT